MREIRVRPVFRVLAGLICLLAIVLFLLDPAKMARHFFLDYFNLAAFLVVMPVFAYSCIFGKLPDSLVERLPDEIYDDFLHAEKNFTQFNTQSIVTAVVALSLGMYFIFRQ